MKTNKSSLLLGAIGLAFAGSALATSGTINITGKVTDTTCNISVNGQGNIATVTLPTVPSSALSLAGNTAGTTPFSIALSDCSGTTFTTAHTFFEAGTMVEMSSGRLNNADSSGGATNVQVELLNSTLSPIKAGATDALQGDIEVDNTAGTTTLNYFARYYATGAAEAGSVNTEVDYTIIYL